MAATAEQIAQLRRMVAEPTEATYSDETAAAYIERYPLLDERGEAPYTYDSTTTPPTQTANTEWIATYDLNAAAADIWDEKTAAIASQYDFSADGSRFDMSKQVQQYEKRARYYRMRQAAKTARLHKWPEENGEEEFPWIGNLPEDDD